MAYAEKRGNGPTPWRVKYMTPAGERSRPGFATKQEALDWGREQEAEVRRRRWRDPKKGDITLREWIRKWAAAQDLAETTDENYAYMIVHHILPAFGGLTLNDLEQMDPMEFDSFEADVRRKGLAASVAAKARSVLGTILEDAVLGGWIDKNPARKRRRRGRQDIHASATEESLWLDENQTLETAERASMISGRPDEFLEVIVRGYTGMRGGEIRGLERRYCRLGEIRVEWQFREVRGRFIKAPPKQNSRRDVHLPPFLTSLMSDHLQRVKPARCECHGGDYIFRAQDGSHQGRSNFANRYFRPAVDGLPVPYKDRARLPLLVNGEGRLVIRRGRWDRAAMEARAVASWLPIEPGATPHDLRHSHKTWMIGDLIPEAAQFKRLGHKLPGIQRIYSHIEPEILKRLLAGLERRWVQSLKARARKGPSSVPVLQALLEPHLGHWELISQIPPIGGAKIISPVFRQVG
ncbi:tyrosine-type recombinase/integrase [Nonomuraea sp. NPDC059023]|uniref:tyrosine-type recombinase/integrase n=1 Tax=Nonomuraea sp. NPDC059023 TaxID=3346706 RepID=UPI00367E0C91